jgi:hypothetical protein
MLLLEMPLDDCILFMFDCVLLLTTIELFVLVVYMLIYRVY